MCRRNPVPQRKSMSEHWPVDAPACEAPTGHPVHHKGGPKLLRCQEALEFSGKQKLTIWTELKPRKLSLQWIKETNAKKQQNYLGGSKMGECMEKKIQWSKSIMIQPQRGIKHWHLLQCEWALETSYSVREAMHTPKTMYCMITFVWNMQNRTMDGHREHISVYQGPVPPGGTGGQCCWGYSFHWGDENVWGLEVMIAHHCSILIARQQNLWCTLCWLDEHIKIFLNKK